MVFEIILKWLLRFIILAGLTLVLVLIVAGIVLVAKGVRDDWEDWRK